MLDYNIIDVTEGIDVNKANESKEYNSFHYWHFLDKGFKFQPDICNVCHDEMMMSINLSNIAIVKIYCVDY